MLKKNIQQDKNLTEEAKSILYSHWIYVSVWLFTSFDQGQSFESIVKKFSLHQDKAHEILNFLVSCGLIEVQNSKFIMTAKSFHIEKGSPHLYRHHMNWRIKAIEKSDSITNEELMYTAPMSMSVDDFKKLRYSMTQLIKSVTDTAINSEAEQLVFFGIDFFKID